MFSRGGGVLCRGDLRVDVFGVQFQRGRFLYEPVDRWTQPNLVVTAGHNLIRDRMDGTGNALSHFAIGTNNTAVTLGDTTLNTEVVRQLITQTTSTSGKLQVKFFLDSATGNSNTLRECGIFNAASAGTMYSRIILVTEIVKTSSIAVTFTYDLTWASP